MFLKDHHLFTQQMACNLKIDFPKFSNTIKFFSMAKYSKKAQDKVETVMHEKKKGTLKSGSGKKVTSNKQAIAIALSEARESGAKVPKKKSPAKKTASKKSAPKKRAAKKSTNKPAKKAAARKK